MVQFDLVVVRGILEPEHQADRAVVRRADGRAHDVIGPCQRFRPPPINIRSQAVIGGEIIRPVDRGGLVELAGGGAPDRWRADRSVVHNLPAREIPVVKCVQQKHQAVRKGSGCPGHDHIRRRGAVPDVGHDDRVIGAVLHRRRERQHHGLAIRRQGGVGDYNASDGIIREVTGIDVVYRLAEREHHLSRWSDSARAQEYRPRSVHVIVLDRNRRGVRNGVNRVARMPRFEEAKVQHVEPVFSIDLGSVQVGRKCLDVQPILRWVKLKDPQITIPAIQLVRKIRGDLHYGVAIIADIHPAPKTVALCVPT